MQVTIFGASGKTGRQVTELCLTNGVAVKALVHNSNPFTNNSLLTLVQGSVYDAASIETALQGSDAVVVTLSSWHGKKHDVLSSAMKSVIPAMEKLRQSRIITLTGAGAFTASDTPGTILKLNHALIRIAAKQVLQDSEQHMELLEKSTLDWTCIRSPIMTNGVSYTYKLTGTMPQPWATVPRRAVAQSIFEQLKDDTWLKHAPAVVRT